ncbi:MAG: NAD-dependent deacylase [Methylomonas lenta]|nr:NAD-dependent deacylase [Methylomonas lenta]
MFDTGLIEKLQRARHVAVFTGAGVSAESGIPTFRDAQTGLWENFDVTQLASPQGYRADKAMVWGWYEWRRMQVLKALPNPAHLAIAALAECVEHVSVITQNVDDLHERAGSKHVIHLHGSLHAPRCFACARPFQLPKGIPEEPVDGRKLMPPHCTHCNGYIRPGVVWFGEMLPEDEWARAELAAKDCDVLLAVGTSSLVWPAAQLPIDAKRYGATVVQINPEITTMNNPADYRLKGKAGDILPALIKHL